MQGTDGRLYGTTSQGGANNAGTVFSLNRDGAGFTVLRHLGHSVSNNTGGPYAALLQASDGRLYGTTQLSSGGESGTIFRLSPDGSGFVVLHTFTGGSGGRMPLGPLLQASDGRLYGTTSQGGAFGGGTVFRIETNGAGFAILRSLAPPDGQQPSGGLIQGADGRLYGTAAAFGPNAHGTVFRLNLDGTGFTVLRGFAYSDGSSPRSALLLRADGKLYGTTFDGGVAGSRGGVFRLNPDGSGFELLRNFGPAAEPSASSAALVIGPDGRMYGTSHYGGAFDTGTIFAFVPPPRIISASTVMATFGQPFTYTIVGDNAPASYAASDLPAGLSLTGAVISGSPAQAGSFTIALTAANGSGTGSATLTLTVGRAPQSITFSAPASRTFGDPSFPVEATATSGLPVSVAVVSGPASIAGGVVTISGAGVVTLRASQTGDGNHQPAPEVERTFTVSKAAAAVTLADLAQTFDGQPKPITPVTNPDGLRIAVTYNGVATPPFNIGSYAVVATVDDANYQGSASGTLVISDAVAPGIVRQPSSAAVTAGTAVGFSIEALGAPPPSFVWQRKPIGATTWSDIPAGGDFLGAMTAMLTIAHPTFAMNGTEFRAIVTNRVGSVESTTVTLGVAPATRFANISVRASMSAGQPLTLGFVMAGGRKQLLIRAVGPGLAAFLPGPDLVAGDPSLAVFDAAGVFVAGNDDWGGSAALREAFGAIGAFALPANSLDAAVLHAMEGPVTAQASSRLPGICLMEAYDTEAGSSTRLINVSAQSHVGAAANVLVVGFAVAGTGTKTVLVRGIGPALTPFGVGGVLGDPTIAVYNGSGAKMAENDDWPSALATVFPQVGAFALPAASRDAALVLVVQPGSYTVQLAGVGGVIGQGLIELYELPD